MSRFRAFPLAFSRLPALSWLSIALLAAALLATAGPAAAGDVYQWKDAKGVTHYSDSPPPNQAYRNRNVRADDPSQPPTGAAKPADSPQCVTARQNLERLKSSAAVGLDANNDGKPDAEMNAEQRAAQVQLSEAAIKAYCTPATATAGTPQP